VKEAFFWFEIEVVELGNFEDIMNGMSVVIEGGASGNADVIHVNADCHSKGFMFEDDVAVYIVHHGLKRCWGVGESKIHDGGFEESVSGFECGFLLIPFVNPYIVITPSDVKLRVYVCVTEVSNEVHD